jgi:ABC-type glycerol-3-phosphate transport system substrate-binding protein
MKRLSRKDFLRAAGGVAGVSVLAACAPQVQVVEKVVKETVEVKVVETVQSVVKEVVTATPVATLGALPYRAHGEVTGRVRFWNCWDASRVRLMTDMISGFHNLYPGITVESLVLACSDLTAKYLTALAGGDPPEVMMMFSSDLAKFVGGGDAMLPLDDRVARDGIDESAYYPAEIQARKYKGQLYLIPQVSALAKTMLYSNNSIMTEIGEKPPESWSDLIEISKKSMKVEGGKVVRNGFFPMFHPELPDPAFGSWLMINNGKLINDELTEMTFNSPEGEEVLEFMLEASDINTDNRPQDMLNTTTADYFTLTRLGFSKGFSAIHIHGSWMFSILASLGMPIDAYTLSAVPVNDKNPNSTLGTATEGGWGFGIPKVIKDPEPAWEWIKYSCYGPASGSFTKAQVRPNPVKAYNEDPDLKMNPHWAKTLEIMNQERAYPTTEAWPVQRERIREMCYSVLYHQETPKAALESCWKDCQAELDKSLRKS